MTPGFFSYPSVKLLVTVMEGYEIIGKETVWEGRFLRCLRLTYRDSKGMVRQWETVERVNCDGVVAVVPVTDNSEVILIRQFRPPVSKYVIEFPAGLNDRGEELKDAASRELLEETGYRAGEMIFLARGPLSSGASREVLTVFLARGLEYIGAGQRDETEDIEVIKIPIDNIYDALTRLVEDGNYIDLKIPGLIEMAKRLI